MFEKFILKRAEKIQAKRKAKQDKKDQEQKKIQERASALKREAKRILEDEIEGVAKMLKPHPLHVKESDRAIINTYQMLFSDEVNSWDGGANTLRNLCEEEMKPIYVRIKNVFVDKSYSIDAIDRFLSNVSLSDMELMVNSEFNLKTLFRAYLSKSKGVKFGLTYGLYLAATFDTEVKFNPTWSLSLDSFLKEGTEEAKETEEIWKEEIAIKQGMKDLRQRQRELEKRQREIDEKYKGIRIVNSPLL